MFEIKLETVLNAVIMQELQEPTDKENHRGMHFEFYCVLEYRGYKARRYLHLFYASPYGRNVHVFSSLADVPFKKPTTLTWDHEVSHDSTWRDLVGINRLYFSSADEINEELKREGKEAVAPIAMDQYVRPSGHSLYEWLPCKVDYDPSDKNRYSRILTILD